MPDRGLVFRRLLIGRSPIPCAASKSRLASPTAPTPIEIPIGVAYGTDPAEVLALLLDLAESNDRVLKDPPPQALFKGFGDSSLDFVLRAWTDQDHEVVASDLALALNRRFADAGI